MSTWTVQNFLKGIGVKERHVEAAATTLQNAGYDNEAYLLLATRESLEAIGVLFPVIDLILSHQQQQQQPVSILRVLLLNQRCCAVHIVDVDSCVLILMAAADYMLLA